MPLSMSTFFFFNDTATTEIYTLALHDALPISPRRTARCGRSGIAPTRAFPGSRKRLALSGRRSEPLRLHDLDRPSGGDGPAERLTSPRWPADLDRGRVIRRSETEIEGQVALGEVTRLPVHSFENTSAVGQHHGDLRAQPFAVRSRPA